MRKLLTLLVALAAVLGATASSFGQFVTLGAQGCGGAGCGGGGGGGTVVFDAVASNLCASCVGSTLQWTHTPVGTPTATAVGIINSTLAGSITGVSYGASGMTQAVQQTISGGGLECQIWGLANPPSGPQTITVNFGGPGGAAQAASISVTGSNTTTTFDSSLGNTAASGTTASVGVTSLSGELMVDVVGNASFASETQGGSQTLRWGPLSTGGGFNIASGSTAPASAGSTTMSWTLNTSAPWTICGASFHK
jgi:hypothetical protein